MSSPVRPCWECKVFDDHPRHVVVQPDQSEVTLHMDCCANRGCQICAVVLSMVDHEPGITGDALRRRLEHQSAKTPNIRVEHPEGSDAYGAVRLDVL